MIQKVCPMCGGLMKWFEDRKEWDCWCGYITGE